MTHGSTDSRIRPGLRCHDIALLAAAGLILAFGSLCLAAANAGSAAQSTAPVSHPSLFQWSPFLAPFHAVVLHYPIGFMTMAFLLELYSLKRPGPELSRITTGVIGVSLLTGLIAAGLGILRAGSGDYAGKSLDMHRAFGIAIPFLIVLTLTLQMISARSGSRTRSLVMYRGALLLTLGSLVIAGHYGGNLTHGSKYLVQNAPEFIKTLLAEEPTVDPEAAPTEGDPASDPAAQLYLTKIRPIFEAKCLTCHGPEKQKGKFRLDRMDLALKGGESGEIAIKPGNPMQSRLVSRILLPRDHDDVMPPDGKEALTPDEMVQIVHWIQRGASFGAAAAPVPVATSQSVSNAIVSPPR